MSQLGQNTSRSIETITPDSVSESLEEELTADQLYYKKPRPSRRSNLKASCEFCGILLISKFGGKLRRKYCDSCAKDPELSRLLYNLYQRNAYRRRVGKPEIPYKAPLIQKIVEVPYGAAAPKLPKLSRVR